MKSENSYVYVVNNDLHDFSVAASYGKCVDVTHGKQPIFKTDVIKEKLKEGLKYFEKKDFLLISGPVILNMMALDCLRQMGFGPSTVKCLVFDAKQQNYVVRHI